MTRFGSVLVFYFQVKRHVNRASVGGSIFVKSCFNSNVKHTDNFHSFTIIFGWPFVTITAISINVVG